MFTIIVGNGLTNGHLGPQQRFLSTTPTVGRSEIDRPIGKGHCLGAGPLPTFLGHVAAGAYRGLAGVCQPSHGPAQVPVRAGRKRLPMTVGSDMKDGYHGWPGVSLRWCPGRGLLLAAPRSVPFHSGLIRGPLGYRPSPFDPEVERCQRSSRRHEYTNTVSIS